MCVSNKALVFYFFVVTVSLNLQKKKNDYKMGIRHVFTSLYSRPCNVMYSGGEVDSLATVLS